MDAPADHGVDIHMKFGMLGQNLELLIQNLETLFGDIVGHDVVDRNLHMIEACPIEPLHSIGGKQIPVGDHARQHAAAAHGGDDFVQIRVQHRFAARKRLIWSQVRQWINGDAMTSVGTGFEIIVFIAVGAG